MTASTPALEPPTGAGPAPAAGHPAAGAPGCLFCGGAGGVRALAVTGGLVIGEDEPIACACVVLGPTPMTRRVAAAIETYTAERGYPPSLRDLGVRFGRSYRTMRDHVERLREAGLLSRERGRGSGRTLRVVRR